MGILVKYIDKYIMYNDTFRYFTDTVMEHGYHGDHVETNLKIYREIIKYSINTYIVRCKADESI